MLSIMSVLRVCVCVCVCVSLGLSVCVCISGTLCLSLSLSLSLARSLMDLSTALSHTYEHSFTVLSLFSAVSLCLPLSVLSLLSDLFVRLYWCSICCVCMCVCGQDRRNALHHASSAVHPSVVMFLCVAGADVNQRDNLVCVCMCVMPWIS